MKQVMICLLFFLLTFATIQDGVFAAARVKTAPRITKTVLYDSHHVKLQWSKVKYAARYRVYRKKANGKFVLVKTTKKRTFYSRNLAYGTKYTYKIKVITKSGRIRVSKPKTVYTKPAKPIVKVKKHEVNVAKVTWKKVKGAVRYKVYRKKGNGKFVFMKTTTRRTFFNRNLAYNTKYVYKVKAVSRAGKTHDSAAKKIVTGKRPVKPEFPVEPSEPSEPLAPEPPDIPEKPAAPDVPPEIPPEPEPVDPPEPGIPEEPSEPLPPEPPEPCITVRIPVYEDKTVYWIKSIDTGEILYQTTDSEIFQQELLTRPDPDSWHWGSGGVQVITGYETLTMTKSEWEESLYHGRQDVIVVTQQENPAGFVKKGRRICKIEEEVCSVLRRCF